MPGIVMRTEKQNTSATEHSVNHPVKREKRTEIPTQLRASMKQCAESVFDAASAHYNLGMPSRFGTLAYTQEKRVDVGRDHQANESSAGKRAAIIQRMRNNVVQRCGPNEGDSETTRAQYGETFEKMSTYVENPNIAVNRNISIRHTAPIQMFRGEQGSVFDFAKLKKYFEFHIPRFGKVKNVWLGKNLNDEELDAYVEKVQTLFEDIRQVDLQFLAVTNASYEENVGNANHSQTYKGLIEKRLAYMHKIKIELVREMRSPDTNRERREILLGYLRNVGRQIKFLRQIINRGQQNSYVFNVNTLLQGPDAEVYMAIPAPSTGRFKDIYIQNDDDRELTMSSDRLQMGIDTPIRAFSWYLKYLLKSDEGVHNPPLIRKLNIPQRILDEEILSNMVSEHRSGNKNGSVPMNEDFKVENQFGIPKSIFMGITERLPDAADRLETIGLSRETPESLRQGAGSFIELDDFKKRIGFARKKGNKTVATDVHFFDFEHTAFFRISNTPNRIKAELYSPKALKETYDEVNEMMENMILKFGTAKALRSKLVSIPSPTIQDGKLNEKIRILLEANHCMPIGRSYDLKGNDINAITDEKKFASDIFLEKETDTRIKILIRNTFERLEQILQSDDGVRNKCIKKIQNDSGLLYEYQNVCARYKNAPALSKLWEQTNAFMGFLYKVAADKKLEVTAFALKLLRIIKQGLPNGWIANDYPEDQELKQGLFASRTTGDHFNSVNMRNADDAVIGHSKIHIPFDKMTSTGRFVPEEAPKRDFVPFVGGASGTTRDISIDLMRHGQLTDEKEYWDFQLLNAAFMISYSYHSFVEVIFRAAAARREYYGSEMISSKIMEYLNFLNQQRRSIQSRELIQNIRRIINPQRQ